MPSRNIAKLLLIAAACSAVPSISRAQTPAATIATDIPQLRATLFDSSSSPAQRESAARKLLARPGADAAAAIGDALKEYPQPPAQLAAARALADAPKADPSFVSPLFALIDVNSPKPLIDAASWSLTAFKKDPAVLTRLLDLAKNGPDEKIRLAAIRAAGTFIDRRVGQTMIELMDPTAQQASINEAAADALAYMTGLKAETSEPKDWRNWWDANKSKSEADFVAEVSRNRAARYDQTQQQLSDLQAEVQRTLLDQYRAAQETPGGGTKLLLGYLQSPQPIFRATGARIAGEEAKRSGSTPATVKDQLRQLVTDGSAQVRREAAMALYAINDPDALTPLLTQLGQETDSTVREAIATALGPISDLKSVPALIALLSDSRLKTVEAAAAALNYAELGKRLRDENPLLANEAAKALLATLQTRTSEQNNVALRRTLINAITPMASKELSRDVGPQLTRMLDRDAEHPSVRQALLEAVAALKDPNAEATIARWVNGTSDIGVRLAAVNALGQIANSFDYGELLGKLLDPKTEPSAELQKAAWSALINLFPTGTDVQLETWQDRLKNDPAKQLVVLKILRDRYHAAGNTDRERSLNQQLGEAAKDAKDYALAVTSLSEALKMAESSSNAVAIEMISESYLESLLFAKKYFEAVQFVQSQIAKDPKFQSLGPKIPLEVERLVNDSKEYDNARLLIDLARKMNPPLRQTSVQRLDEIARQIQNRSREQNRNSFPEHPQNVRAD